jgi:hypothetical protein
MANGEHPQGLSEILLEQNKAMAAYALSIGLALPPEIAVLETKQDLQALSALHAKLTSLVEPATPDVITELYRRGEVEGTGTNRFVLWMFLAGAVSLALFVLGIALAISSAGGGANPALSNRLVDLTSWNEILVKLAYVLGAAGIGAAFSTLFQINSYAVRKAFNKAYESVYWVKFGLGLIAGLLLVEFLEVGGGFGVGTLALVGGFTSTVVYRMLKRLIDALESIFTGDMTEYRRAAERIAEMRAEGDIAQARIQAAARLAQLKASLLTSGVAESALGSVDQLVSDLLQGTTGAGGQPQTPSGSPTSGPTADMPAPATGS